LVRYVQAVKGQGAVITNSLPFLCPDLNYLERMLASREAIVILAKEKDVIVGVVGGWLEGTPSGYDIEDRFLKQSDAYHEAHLDWIAVKKEFRKKKIGVTLVEKICKWAIGNGKKRIWTEASEDTAIFYSRLGFEKIGRFRDEKGERYVTMLRQL